MISIIAAIGAKRELGHDNKLLWNIPQDMKRFRELTMGHPVIMGRKTYESIFGYLGRPLPGRTTIVITNKDRYDVPEGVYVVNDIPSAVQKAQACPGAQEIFVIGGASVYSQALNLTDRLYITHIEQAYAQADCFFPEFDTLFTLDTAIRHEGAPAYTFARYRKQ